MKLDAFDVPSHIVIQWGNTRPCQEGVEGEDAGGAFRGMV